MEFNYNEKSDCIYIDGKNDLILSKGRSAILFDDSMYKENKSTLVIKNFSFLGSKSKIKATVKAIAFIWRA